MNDNLFLQEGPKESAPAAGGSAAAVTASGTDEKADVEDVEGEKKEQNTNVL